MAASTHDTELARLLHRANRVDVATLKSILEEARATRGTGADTSLADLLVARGLLSREETAELLARTAPADSRLQQSQASGPSRRASGRFEAEWRPGALVGDLRLLHPLGKGAMGVVWVAQGLHSDVRRAIKTIRDTEPGALARFRREGEAQARVDAHPNVARVHASGEHGGRPYLVLELVEGESLAERVHRAGPLPPDRAAAIGAGIARGLGHLHAHGVLHRDLKPANVLLDADGAPKLVDFGLARVAGTSRLTLSGELVGTPAFMAPEQALGQNQRVGPATDVYALGALLYYLLTGRDPFPGRTTVEVIDRLVNEAPEPPRRIRPELPEPLERVVLSALAKEPEARPPVATLAEALEALARGEALATGDLPAPPGSRWIPALAVLALLGVGLASAALVLSATAEPTPAAAPAPAAQEAAPQPKPAFLVWGWQPGQERRVSLKLETLFKLDRAPGPGAAQERWERTHRRRYVALCRAEAVEDGRVRLRLQLEEVSVFRSGAQGFKGWWAGVEEESIRGDPVARAKEAPFGLRLDMRTGQVDEVEGLDALRAVLREAHYGDDDAFEVESPGALAEALGRLLHLTPAGLVDPERTSQWTVPRTWERANRLTAGAIELPVEARRSSSGGWALRTAGDTQGRLLMRWRAIEVAGHVEGQATLGPRGLEGSQVQETWRGEGVAFDAKYELRVGDAR